MSHGVSSQDHWCLLLCTHQTLQPLTSLKLSKQMVAWWAELQQPTSHDSPKATKHKTTAPSKPKKTPNSSNNIMKMMVLCEVLALLRKFKSFITRQQCQGISQLMVRTFNRCNQVGRLVEPTCTAKVVQEALKWY